MGSDSGLGAGRTRKRRMGSVNGLFILFGTGIYLRHCLIWKIWDNFSESKASVFHTWHTIPETDSNSTIAISHSAT